MQPPADRYGDLYRCFELQLALCDGLEAIADSLPDHVNRQLCLDSADVIGPTLRHLHVAEETTLIPELLLAGPPGERLVDSLRAEQIEDRSLAEEVEYELKLLGESRPTIGAETTGYMLRGFFQGLRRHVRREIALTTLLDRLLTQ